MLIVLPIEIICDQMGAEEKDGDVSGIRTAILPGVLGVSASGPKEGGARNTEIDGSDPGSLRSDARKLQRLDKGSWGGDEGYRVAACLASFGADGT